MTYPLQVAIDLLDRLTTGHEIARAELVRGTIALALHARGYSPALDDDIGAVLQAFEHVLLGGVHAFDADSARRMTRVVAALRPAVGVH